jgi:hypothetical protein
VLLLADSDRVGPARVQPCHRLVVPKPAAVSSSLGPSAPARSTLAINSSTKCRAAPGGVGRVLAGADVKGLAGVWPRRRDRRHHREVTAVRPGEIVDRVGA